MYKLVCIFIIQKALIPVFIVGLRILLTFRPQGYHWGNQHATFGLRDTFAINMYLLPFGTHSQSTCIFQLTGDLPNQYVSSGRQEIFPINMYLLVDRRSSQSVCIFQSTGDLPNQHVSSSFREIFPINMYFLIARRSSQSTCIFFISGHIHNQACIFWCSEHLHSNIYSYLLNQCPSLLMFQHGGGGALDTTVCQ